GGPFQHALGRRHEGDAAFRIFTKKSEIGRRIADAEDALALRIGPALPDAAIDQLPRHGAEALRIEITEIDDVDAHGSNLTRSSCYRRVDHCIARSALTPYLWESAQKPREIPWPPISEPSTASATISAIWSTIPPPRQPLRSTHRRPAPSSRRWSARAGSSRTS